MMNTRKTICKDKENLFPKSNHGIIANSIQTHKTSSNLDHAYKQLQFQQIETKVSTDLKIQHWENLERQDNRNSYD